MSSWEDLSHPANGDASQSLWVGAAVVRFGDEQADARIIFHVRGVFAQSADMNIKSRDMVTMVRIRHVSFCRV